MNRLKLNVRTALLAWVLLTLLALGGCTTHLAGPSPTVPPLVERPDHFTFVVRGHVDGREVNAVGRFDDQPRAGYENYYGWWIEAPINVWTRVTVEVGGGCEAGAYRTRAAGLFDLLLMPTDPAVQQWFQCPHQETRLQTVTTWQEGWRWVVLIEELKAQ